MARPRKPRGTTATPSELQTMIDAACYEARIKTQAHQLGWRHGEEDGWDLDQEDGVLVFTFADGSEARCPAQIIGTFDGKTSTWMWAWNNPSIERSLLADSLALRVRGGEGLRPPHRAEMARRGTRRLEDGRPGPQNLRTRGDLSGPCRHDVDLHDLRFRDLPGARIEVI